MRRQDIFGGAPTGVTAENRFSSGSNNNANIAANSSNTDSLSSLKQPGSGPMKPIHQRRRPALGDITNSVFNKPVSRRYKVTVPRLVPRGSDGLIEEPEYIPPPGSPVRPPSPRFDSNYSSSLLPAITSPEVILPLPPLTNPPNLPQTGTPTNHADDAMCVRLLSSPLKLFSIDELITFDDDDEVVLEV